MAAGLEPLTLDDLAAHLASGCKPTSEFRVGSEHEKFVFRVPGHQPVPYEGEAGIHALLTGLKRHGWAENREEPAAPHATQPSPGRAYLRGR